MVVPVGRTDLEVAVGPERREHPAGERRVLRQQPVVGEVVARVVRRGQDLDAEPLEQGPGPELRGRQRRGDAVVDLVGGVGRGADVDAEEFHQLDLHPVAHRGPAVGGPVLAERPERPAGPVGVQGGAHPQVAEVDALGVQHPRHVVVGGDEQRRRVPEGGVVGEPRRRHVAVGERIGNPETWACSRRAISRRTGSAGSRRSGSSCSGAAGVGDDMGQPEPGRRAAGH